MQNWITDHGGKRWFLSRQALRIDRMSPFKSTDSKEVITRAAFVLPFRSAKTEIEKALFPNQVFKPEALRAFEPKNYGELFDAFCDPIDKRKFCIPEKVWRDGLSQKRIQYETEEHPKSKSQDKLTEILKEARNSIVENAVESAKNSVIALGEKEQFEQESLKKTANELFDAEIPPPPRFEIQIPDRSLLAFLKEGRTLAMAGLMYIGLLPKMLGFSLKSVWFLQDVLVFLPLVTLLWLAKNWFVKGPEIREGEVHKVMAVIKDSLKAYEIRFRGLFKAELLKQVNEQEKLALAEWERRNLLVSSADTAAAQERKELKAQISHLERRIDTLRKSSSATEPEIWLKEQHSALEKDREARKLVIKSLVNVAGHEKRISKQAIDLEIKEKRKTLEKLSAIAGPIKRNREKADKWYEIEQNRSKIEKMAKLVIWKKIQRLKLENEKRGLLARINNLVNGNDENKRKLWEKAVQLEIEEKRKTLEKLSSEAEDAREREKTSRWLEIEKKRPQFLKKAKAKSEPSDTYEKLLEPEIWLNNEKAALKIEKDDLSSSINNINGITDEEKDLLKLAVLLENQEKFNALKQLKAETDTGKRNVEKTWKWLEIAKKRPQLLGNAKAKSEPSDSYEKLLEPEIWLKNEKAALKIEKDDLSSSINSINGITDEEKELLKLAVLLEMQEKYNALKQLRAETDTGKRNVEKTWKWLEIAKKRPQFRMNAKARETGSQSYRELFEYENWREKEEAALQKEQAVLMTAGREVAAKWPDSQVAEQMIRAEVKAKKDALKSLMLEVDPQKWNQEKEKQWADIEKKRSEFKFDAKKAAQNLESLAQKFKQDWSNS